MATQIVGDFELGELLGAGTVGDVYRARHCQSGAPAVIKFLQHHANAEVELQRRFVREVAIVERLNHPNIVRHYDCGLADDRIYFAMELVECGTLQNVLRRRGKLPWREAVECACQICAALEYAHRAGVIHRDLKPANLFLAEDGKLKVGDFGLARDLNNSRLTLDGQTVGTCRYMPPEQITGDEAVTGAVDLYAMGCILYEMLVGRTPYDGRSVVEIFDAHLNDFAREPRELVRDCPLDLSELVMLLLEKSPQDRPGDAAAVHAALVDILRGRPMQLTARPAADLDAERASALPLDQPNLTARLHAPPVSAIVPGKAWPWVWAVVSLIAVAAIVAALFIAR